MDGRCPKFHPRFSNCQFTKWKWRKRTIMFSLSELKNTERGKCDHLLAYSRQTDMRRVIAWLVNLVRFMCSQKLTQLKQIPPSISSLLILHKASTCLYNRVSWIWNGKPNKNIPCCSISKPNWSTRSTDFDTHLFRSAMRSSWIS